MGLFSGQLYITPLPKWASQEIVDLYTFKQPNENDSGAATANGRTKSKETVVQHESEESSRIDEDSTSPVGNPGSKIGGLFF